MILRVTPKKLAHNSGIIVRFLVNWAPVIVM